MFKLRKKYGHFEFVGRKQVLKKVGRGNKKVAKMVLVQY